MITVRNIKALEPTRICRLSLLLVFALFLLQSGSSSALASSRVSAQESFSELQGIPIGVDQQKPTHGDTRTLVQAIAECVSIHDGDTGDDTGSRCGALYPAPTIYSLLVFTLTTTAGL
jgi:hypothetical protein